LPQNRHPPTGRFQPGQIILISSGTATPTPPVSRLSHLTFPCGGKQAGEEIVIPAGAFELPLDRSVGSLDFAGIKRPAPEQRQVLRTMIHPYGSGSGPRSWSRPPPSGGRSRSPNGSDGGPRQHGEVGRSQPAMPPSRLRRTSSRPWCGCMSIRTVDWPCYGVGTGWVITMRKAVWWRPSRSPHDRLP
jgi:hypothetical protein